MGGKIYQMKLKYNKAILTPDMTPEKIKINISDLNKLLGLNLTENQVKKQLEKMEYSYKSKTVSVPAYRTDILHPVDIYEDIAIGYGYENFKSEIPKVSTIGQESEDSIFKRKITDILIGLGLLETSSFHLTNTNNQIKKMCLKEESIKLVDSKTEYNTLRKNLLSNSLRILSENIDSEYPQDIFEIGTVFKQENKIQEKTNLIVTKTPGYYTEIKQILQYLFEMLEIKFKIQPTFHSSFIEGRAGQIIINNKPVGIIGEIHPQVLKNWHLKMPVAVFELCIDDLT